MIMFTGAQVKRTPIHTICFLLGPMVLQTRQMMIGANDETI